MKLALEDNYFIIRLLQDDVWSDKNNWEEELNKCLKDISDNKLSPQAIFLSKSEIYKNHQEDLANYKSDDINFDEEDDDNDEIEDLIGTFESTLKVTNINPDSYTKANMCYYNDSRDDSETKDFKNSDFYKNFEI